MKTKEEEFKKYVLQKLILDISFEETKGSLMAGAVDASSRLLNREVVAEGKSTNYGFTEEKINQLISEVENEGRNFQTNKSTVQYIDVDTLPVGQSIYIEYQENGSRHSEEFIKTAVNEFLLVNHSRGYLRCGDTFMSSGEWKVGFPVDFRVKNQANTTYSTLNLTNIELWSGDELYDIIGRKYIQN